MNKVILCGRLTKDPEVRYSQSGMAIARYTLAVDRRRKQDGEQNADFIRCTVFDKGGEFAEKYFKQGTKILITGRIQTGSYEDSDGKRVYTTDIIVEDQEFAESKKSAEAESDDAKEDRRRKKEGYGKKEDDEFMTIPDGVDDDGLPFV